MILGNDIDTNTNTIANDVIITACMTNPPFYDNNDDVFEYNKTVNTACDVEKFTVGGEVVIIIIFIIVIIIIIVIVIVIAIFIIIIIINYRLHFLQLLSLIPWSLGIGLIIIIVLFNFIIISITNSL